MADVFPDPKVGDVIVIRGTSPASLSKSTITKVTAHQFVAGGNHFDRATGTMIGTARSWHPVTAKPWSAEADKELDDQLKAVRLKKLVTRLRYYPWHTLRMDQAVVVLKAMDSAGLFDPSDLPE